MKPMPKGAYQHRKKVKLRYRETWYARPSCGGKAFPAPLCEKGGEVSGAVKEIEKKTVCTNMFLGFLSVFATSCWGNSREFLKTHRRPPGLLGDRRGTALGPRAAGNLPRTLAGGPQRWCAGGQVAELSCPMPSMISLETGGQLGATRRGSPPAVEVHSICAHHSRKLSRAALLRGPSRRWRQWDGGGSPRPRTENLIEKAHSRRSPRIDLKSCSRKE